MTKSGLLAAAAMLAALVATPALAQPAVQEPGAYAQYQPWANDYNYRYGRTGFWPGDVAADVVGGGAAATADAIVSAPFRGSDSYAYYGRRPRYDLRLLRQPAGAHDLWPGALCHLYGPGRPLVSLLGDQIAA